MTTGGYPRAMRGNDNRQQRLAFGDDALLFDEGSKGQERHPPGEISSGALRVILVHDDEVEEVGRELLYPSCHSSEPEKPWHKAK